MVDHQAKVLSRREALSLAGSFAAVAAMPGVSRAADATPPLMWGNLLHLSMNMWADQPVKAWGNTKPEHLSYVAADKTKLRFDEALYRELVDRMVKAGMNLVVIDLGDAVVYESHPEIAVQGAWSRAKLREELKRLRDVGLEPIPKMNFSTAHDIWLGEYSRMVSTPTYYKVCGELIDEVIDLFDTPRFFHLGYDEETAGHQAKYQYVVVRQHEQWWNDFDFFVQRVQAKKVRPWIWSDYYWAHSEAFLKRMPKSVLQSNWYYGMKFDPAKEKRIKTYLDLAAAGYEQVPTGSNWSTAENFEATAKFCRANLSAERLRGFLQTPWRPTVPEYRDHHLQAIDVVGQAIRSAGS
ncbi:Tat pathway signal protein [Planctomycetales bacterium ZRK34]|nr:Tat pathway signal protein [Planctomycetales bacterium ZRK34]